MARKKTKRRRRILKIFLLLVLVFAVMVMDSNYRIDVTEYELSYTDLPKGFDGFRIVSLSDIHEADFGEGNKNLLDKVEKAEPDIIAVTGDLIDEPGHEAYVRNLMESLLNIAPVYYVTGNHEWASGAIQELFAVLEETGVTVLRNDYVKLERGGETIVLAGVDDPNGPYDMKTPAELMEEIRAQEGEEAFVVLLAHRNDKIDLYSQLQIPLVLCGHGHGGVVRLPFTDGLINTNREWFPTYTSGVYTENGTDMLVSRGLGNNTGMFRFLNNPHIPVAVLKAA